jgi:hypothetical protein
MMSMNKQTPSGGRGVLHRISDDESVVVISGPGGTVRVQLATIDPDNGNLTVRNSAGGNVLSVP